MSKPKQFGLLAIVDTMAAFAPHCTQKKKDKT